MRRCVDPCTWRGCLSIGTRGSPGSKLFCLSGDVARPGAVEVPFGTAFHDLLELAGGVTGEVQAVLVGRAAGRFAKLDQLSLPVSFEALQSFQR